MDIKKMCTADVRDSSCCHQQWIATIQTAGSAEVLIHSAMNTVQNEKAYIKEINELYTFIGHTFIRHMQKQYQYINERNNKSKH